MKPRAFVPLVLSALCAVALCAAPAASAAGTVATGRACYVAKGSEGVNVDVTGSGFTAGEAVFAQIPAPGGLAGFTETTVNPDGTLSATVEHVFPESIEPVAEKKVMQIKGVLSDQILAEVPFQITNLAVKTIPATAAYHKVVTYVFAGFRPHKPIFGHYFRHHHLVVTHEFGKSHGPCGTLHAKARLFPGNGPRAAKYKVQFDDSKKVNPKAHPKIVTSLGSIF
ncbi:MAG TPA: hypothetical protein VHA80_09145 [Solirubrobacterales bacterium]|jgi:hypothetical protein|nr:hypothetical protein [Solirubrobacterales bacterium]